MIKEVRDRGFVCTRAATALGYFPAQVEDSQEALLGGLLDKDGNLRQACVESLGLLNARGSVKALIKHYPTEKNYRVRMALCEAFAALEATEALPILKSALSGGEDDLVRASAALALTRFGDDAGKNFLISALNSGDPAYQMMGLTGLIQLKIPDRAAYLGIALESKWDEVWVGAVNAFPVIGVSSSYPVLRQRLQAPAPPVRRRAAIALGMLGSSEGLPQLVEALHAGNLAERSMATGLIGLLGRKEYIPQLIDRLRDSASAVRQAAAISLVRLQATEAVPALLEAARGAKASTSNLPAAMRGVNQDVNELLLLANAIRVLKGENSPFAVQTLPSKRTLAWPEYDREIFRNQLDLLKSYKLVEVMGTAANPVAVVIQDPNGQENLYKLNEQVAAGFELREFYPSGRSENGQPVPAWCTLYRGDTRIVLVAGRETEIEVGPRTKKEMKMKDDKVDNREGTPDKPFLRR
jgi:HEAT repeat protein